MDKKIEKLKKLNIFMASLHVLQAAAVLVISNNTSREINTSFLGFNETDQTLESSSRALFSVEVAFLVAIFFLISAFAHLYISTIGYKKYSQDLKNNINRFRWYEYSLSASLMIVLIAMLSGIFDLGALLALFGLTAVMNLCGLAMEVHNQTTKETNWLTYKIGAIAGLVPWLVIGVALWAAETTTSGQVPGFVYAIYVSLFVLFNSFAVNMILQYKRTGKWKEYLYGERVYIILSLTAKSLLAWQIYFGALQPL